MSEFATNCVKFSIALQEEHFQNNEHLYWGLAGRTFIVVDDDCFFCTFNKQKVVYIQSVKETLSDLSISFKADTSTPFKNILVYFSR